MPINLYACLVENPDGCPYAAMKGYLQDEKLAKTAWAWPKTCRLRRKWQFLAPPDATRRSQLNTPIGRSQADALAQKLRLSANMTLTRKEYRCLIGTPGAKTPAQRTISICLKDLTNSIGRTPVPLSSWGLSISSSGNIRSNCAPSAPCLAFNALFAGPLEKIAARCGFGRKLAALVKRTPFVEFAKGGSACQSAWEPVCLANKTRVGR